MKVGAENRLEAKKEYFQMRVSAFKEKCSDTKFPPLMSHLNSNTRAQVAAPLYWTQQLDLRELGNEAIGHSNDLFEICVGYLPEKAKYKL